MQILKSVEGTTYFILSDEKKVSVLDIQRNDLFAMMENVYADKRYYELDDVQEMITQIKNPVEREIATQIVEKIKEFAEQVDNLKARLIAQYPEA